MKTLAVCDTKILN